MGAVTFKRKITTTIPPAKIFKVLVLEADNAVPTILPQLIKSVEILEGDGGPGTIKKTNFAEGKQLYLQPLIKVNEFLIAQMNYL